MTDAARPPPDRVSRRVVAHGRVQGVFFRDTCRRRAGTAGVAGWVRNTDEGTVEAVFEGVPAAVERMLAWAEDGPPAARVSRLDVHDEPFAGLTGFEVR